MDHLDYLKVANYFYASFQLLMVLIIGFWGSFVVFQAFLDDTEILELVMLALPYLCPSLLLVVHAFVLVSVGRSVQWGGGRILQTLMALFNICQCPFGTLWAGYSIWVCWINADSRKEFEED